MNPTPGTWLNHWISSIDALSNLSPWVLTALGIVLTFCFVILPSATLMSFLERKLAADFQARVGPAFAGPAGFLQPIVDFIKLLQKSSMKRTTKREIAWLSVHTMALYSTVAVLPLGSTALLVDTDLSAFLPFWAALVLALGSMFLGLSQGTVPGWFGGIRIASQALAGGFPALVTLLAAGVAAGGFKWSVIVETQGASPLGWTAFSNPFQAVALVCFVVSGLVLLGISPMDAAYSGSDIHGGVVAHLSSRRLTLFRLGRFYGFFLWSLIAVVLFLGGWNLPFGIADRLVGLGEYRVLQIFELFLLMIKSFVVMLLVVWVARVNPRARVDQVTDFAWTVLSPFSLFALIGACFWAAWRGL